MLDISDKSITQYISDYYGITVHSITFLPIGADANAAVYKADTDYESFFIKVKKGNHDDVNFAALNLLQKAGVEQIILPIKTISGESVQNIEDLTLIVYPFITGKNGFEQPLTEAQLLSLGKALRKLHEIDIPISLQKRLRREAYSPKFRELMRSLYAYIETNPILDGIELTLKNFMEEHTETIHRLIDNAEQLAKKLQNETAPFVMCHSDIHAGNVLIDEKKGIYIVDWDDPIMAPKERDLMFIGGGICNVWDKEDEETIFYKGYGKTEVNRTILAYYRHERIIEDIALYGENILLTKSNNETKMESYYYFKRMFEPKCEVDIAFKTYEIRNLV